MTLPITEEIRDFSRPNKVLRFRIDDDTFEARGMVAAERILEMTSLGDRIDSAEDARKLDVMVEIFRIALTPESFERFDARLRDDDNPIGLIQVTDLIQWLMESYAGRPTQLPAD